jgi:hypothetical protein
LGGSWATQGNSCRISAMMNFGEACEENLAVDIRWIDCLFWT